MINHKNRITFAFRLIYTIAAVIIAASTIFKFLPYSVVAPTFTGITALFFVFKSKEKDVFYQNLIENYHKSVYYLFFANFTLLAWPYMQRIPISFAFVACTTMSIFYLAVFTYRLMDSINIRFEVTKLFFDTLLAAIVVGYSGYIILDHHNVFANLNMIKLFLIVNLLGIELAFYALIMMLLTVKIGTYNIPVLSGLIGEILLLISHFSITVYLLHGNLDFNRWATFFLLLGSMLIIQFYDIGFKGLEIEENDVIRAASSKLYTYANIGLNFKFLIITVLPVALFLYGKIDIISLIYLLILIVFYMNIMYFFQNRSLDRLNLSNETAINASLKKIVDAKTVELSETNKLLEELSTTDQLTKLPNRIAFYNYLEKMVDSKAEKFSLLYLDLNKFKLINDIYGHDKGDFVLEIISERLVVLSGDDVKAFRVGGDEFTIVSTLVGHQKIDALCEKIIESIEKPIFNNGLIFYLGTSIGVAIYGEENINTVDDLIKSSDIAMYQTKYDEASKNYAYFKREYAEMLKEQTEISHKLEVADFDSDFKLVYQPIFDPYTEKIIKIEALLRWDDDGKMIPPSVFIPLSEKNGVIKEITQWVFKTAIKDIKLLYDNYCVDFQLTINVSPKNILDDKFIDYLGTIKGDSGFDVSCIEIEITENFSVMTLTHIKQAIEQIKALGYGVSIDDFGTGYSSLEYLKEFSVDTMKIAKELIDNINQTKGDEKMVSSLIGLSKALSLKTVIEGVETKEQLIVLKKLGCDYIQGYYYAKPLPIDALIKKFIVKGEGDDVTNL